MSGSKGPDWRSLPWTEWANTGEATLYLVPRGLTTGSVPDAGSNSTLTLDVCDSCLVVEAEGGARERVPLEPMSVADFLIHTRRAVEAVGGTFDIHGRPKELPDPVLAFEDDRAPRPWDADAVRRYHRALSRIDRVFTRSRTAWLGKGSPSHLF